MPDIFDIVADSTRREILGFLLGRVEASANGSGESSVSEIVNALELSQPTVSKQLKVLRECDLVSVRDEGQHRYYKLNSAPLEHIQDWLIPFLGGEEVAADAAMLAGIGLARDQRLFAENLGKKVADVTAAVKNPLEKISRRLDERF